MPTKLCCAVVLGAMLGCPADRRVEPAAGDTAAVRMERDGAVPEKTLPDGEVDTTVVTPPGVPQGARAVTP
jgi:hypothetical protein